MRRLQAALTIKRLPNLAAFALASNLTYQDPQICFDTDSFVISVNTYALVMMGNHPDQFKDLKLHREDDTGWRELKEGL